MTERRHRTMTRAAFDALCAEVGGVSSPEALLHYLDAAGVVIHRPGLFDDQIILDHAWAFEAVYAVFDRKACYQQLRAERGRFTRPLLEAFVWGKHSQAEQELFLGLMISCGVCFVHRKGDPRRGLETEYIAPDLLPDREQVAEELEWMWAGHAPGGELTVNLPFLHPGLMRGLISRIGQKAGLSALYWKDGVCFYEQRTQSRALIEQRPIQALAAGLAAWSSRPAAATPPRCWLGCGSGWKSCSSAREARGGRSKGHPSKPRVGLYCRDEAIARVQRRKRRRVGGEGPSRSPLTAAPSSRESNSSSSRARHPWRAKPTAFPTPGTTRARRSWIACARVRRREAFACCATRRGSASATASSGS